MFKTEHSEVDAIQAAKSFAPCGLTSEPLSLEFDSRRFYFEHTGCEIEPFGFLLSYQTLGV